MWRSNVGSPSLPEGGFDSGSVFGRLSVDRLDNSHFPSKGYSGNIEYELFRDGLGNDQDLDQIKVDLSYFETFGAHTFGLGGRFQYHHERNGRGSESLSRWVDFSISRVSATGAQRSTPARF